MDIGASFKIAASVAGQQAVDKLNTSLQQTQGLAKTVGLGLVGLGAGVGLSVLKEKFEGVVEGLVRVKEAAEKTGASGDKISTIFQAAKITGDNFDSIEAGIIKMDKALAGSDNTAKGAAHALDALGLSIKDLRGMDPADAFRKIAEQLGKFEDGAGKTAVAMDIFGKRGAELLPFMKDYAEMGNLVSKSTDEQREQADQYRKSLNALKATKNELYKVISMELLPVANAFVQTLVDTNKETTGVRGAVKQLASDGVLTTVFKEAARAAAAFLDIMSLIFKAVQQVGSSLAVVVNDVITVAEMAVKAPTALFKHGGVEELKEIWRLRGEFTKAANEDMAARFSGSMTPYSDKLEDKFSAMGQSHEKKARSNGLNGFKSEDSDSGPAADPFQTELDSMGREAAKLQFMTAHIKEYEDRITSARAAQTQFDIEQGTKFKSLSEKQKTMLMMQAEAVDTFAEKLRQAKIGLEFDKQTKSIDAETRAQAMGTAEKQIAIAMQDLENKGIKQGTELFDELIARRKRAIEQQQAAKGDWQGGMVKGLKDYAEEAGDIFKSVQGAVTHAFKGMEDALVEFTMTGKLSFNDLALSIIKDLVRIQIQQSIMKPLTGILSGGTGMLGGMFGGMFGNISAASTYGTNIGSQQTSMLAAQDAGMASFDGGGYTGGGARSGGLDGNGGFLAMMHPQETVIDHTKGQGTGGNVSVNVTVNAQTGQAQGEGGDMGKLGVAIGAAVRSTIIQERRPGGLLAA